MRLVIDGRRLTSRRTGVGRCLEGLLRVWAEGGWPLEPAPHLLVAQDPAGLAQVPDSPGLTRLLIGSRWPGLAWETWGLGRVLRPGDVLLAPANLIPLTWRGPTLLVIHDTLSWSHPEGIPRRLRLQFDWRYRQAARRATAIVATSESTARDVARVHGVPRERLTVAYQGPAAEFRPLPRDHSVAREARHHAGVGDGPYFLFVGKRSARRNVPAILGAFAQHRERHPGTFLVFVGPEGGDPLPDREAGVVNLGHVAEATLVGLLAGALGLLYPSRYEGFGLPVVEAMACGCPVVTLRNSALVETAGEAAAFLPSAEPEAIAAVMGRLATDPGWRADLAARGGAHVERFSQVAFAGTVSAGLRRVAGRPQSEA